MLKRERKAVARSREKISENAIADGHMRTELEKLMDVENVRRKHIQASTIVGMLWLSGKSNSYYGNRNFTVEMVFSQRELLFSRL